MSFESDITHIKRLVEEEEVFKPATPEEVANRAAKQEASQAKELYDHAESVMPGIVEKLRAIYGSEALVQTAIAYADCGEVEAKLGISYASEEDRWGFNRSGYKIRNLEWVGVWTDGPTFIKQSEIIGGYNEFDTNIAKGIVDMFEGRQFKLAREGSVAVYVKPVKETEMGWLSEGSNTFGADEADLEHGGILRLWWD